jgi:hypothetical protein
LRRRYLTGNWILTLALFVVLTSMIASIPRAQASGCRSLDKWSLWTHGNLRGFNLFAEHAYPTWETTGALHFPYTQADLYAISALGANFVQISYPGLFRMRPPYKVDSDAQSSLDRLLKMVGKAGLKAVIAFRTGPGRNEYAFRYQNSYDSHFVQHLYEPLWNSRQAQNSFVSMMRYTASRYKSDCTVIGYDPLVEPNYVSVAADQTGNYLDPSQFYAKFAGSIHDWNQLTPRITSAIRAVDKNTPILLEPDGYGSVQFLPYLKVTGDPRTVYTIHNYEPQQAYTHQAKDGTVSYPGLMDLEGDGTKTMVDRNWQSALFQPLRDFKASNSVPVAVTEMGAHRFIPGVLTFLTDEFDLLDQIGASYALWEWPAPSDNDYDFDIRRGIDPNNEASVPSNPLMTLVETRFNSTRKN